MAASDLPPLRDVIKRYGLSARKGLGQHFLLDTNLTQRIVRAAGDLTGRHVIEIGPGPGGLTRALLDSPAECIYTIEKDRRCLDALGDLKFRYGDRLQVIEGDGLEIDIPNIVQGPRKIVANLPYNVATPMLLRWLRDATAFEAMTLMFQTEVADRLVGVPRTKAYGRLSVITQWLCTVTKAFNVSKDAFTPPPKVSSTVVTLTPRSEPVAPAEWTDIETVTAAAFGQRRKMLRSSLKSLGIDPKLAGVVETARAEELSVAEFCALARLLPHTDD